ncbi:2',5'-phosphodiesterase 12-like [Mya arenaria]|uniref:2',5'-phosphodiesterase 12-like n=1 Tax=Mya arenaria TaxID=6604 RepID=UPI0022E29835|nr:2',5'-phosphodiesterase 12-like [Mya arenaria]
MICFSGLSQSRRRIFYHISRNMSKFYVRNVENDRSLQITFEYSHTSGEKILSRVYNASRPKSEIIDNTLTRISQNISKFISKKLKRKLKADGESSLSEINIKVYKNDGITTLEENTSTEDAFQHGNVVAIENSKFIVDINAPCCNAIVLPQTVMIGFQICPNVEIEFASLEDSLFVWEKLKYDTSAKMGQKDITQVPKERVELSKSLTFTPTNDEIGYRLALTMTPRLGDREGKPMTVECKYDVTAGPDLCPFEQRHLYTQKETGSGELRVVSYNILADVYANQEFSRNVLFNYCPPYALDISYRKHLMIKELKGYKGDIICLQECDYKVFIYDFVPVFELLGFQGLMREKGGVREGSAIFFRMSKFRLVEEHSTLLKDFMETDKSCQDLVKQTYAVPALKEMLETRSTIIHVAALEPVDRPGQILLVANTHLYFHPDFAHVRLIQTITSMRFINKLFQQYKKQKPCLVFCGDFNSTPTRGVYEFMTTKSIKEDHDAWRSGGEDQFVAGMNFSHTFNIGSGCGLPAYTNYTNGFNGHLDYVFYDTDAFEVSQVIPQPDHKDVEFHTAIPSIVFPSDHLAQICDLRWKNPSHL